VRPGEALVLAVAAASLAAPALRAEEGSHPLLLHRWSIEDGLPHAHVRSITQTTDGFLWMATDRGLARFDGVLFSVFDRARVPEMPSDHVDRVWTDPADGGLHAATPGGGGWLRDGVWKSDARISPDSRVLGVTAEGSVILQRDRRLFQVTASSTSFVAELPGAARRVRTAAVGDAIWLATDAGLVRVHGGAVEVIGRGLPDPDVHAILVDRERRVWVGTSKGLAVQERPTGPFVAVERFASAGVWALLQSRDGAIWVGSEGLSRLDGKTVESLGREAGISSNVVALAEDAYGQIWAGTFAGGLYRARRALVDSYTRRDGLTSDSVTTVLRDQMGDTWIGTYHGGLSRFRNGRLLRHYGSADGLGTDQVYALEQGRSGRLWIGTFGAGLRWLCGDRICAAPAVPDPLILALAEADDGRLWIGTPAGLSVVENGIARPWEPDTIHGPVRALRIDGHGDLWVGAAGGLVRMAGGRPVETIPCTRDEEILALTLGPTDGMWMGTTSGLRVRTPSGWRRLTSREGLPDDAVHQVLEDFRGDLWIGGERGIAQITRAQIQDFLEGRRTCVEPRLLTTADGLPSIQTSRDSQPLAAAAAPETLLFATAGGVAVVHPARLERSATPLVAVDEALTDGRAYHGRGWTAGPALGSLEFHYTAPLLVNSDGVQFRYRLRGYSAWVEAGTRRIAIFTRVPAGAYAFEVEARMAGLASSSPTTALSVPFKVAPSWHERMAVRAAALVALAAMATLVYRIRVARLLAKERELADILWADRQEVSRRLHDSINQLLFSLSLTAEAAQERLPAEPLLRQLVRLSQAALSSARLVMAELRPPRSTGDHARVDVAESLRQYLAAVAGSELQVHVTTNYRSQGSAFDRDLLRIAQEAINNAVRHARARTLAVTLASTAEGVHLRVEDDGIGIPKPSLIEAGTGLNSMRRRAESLGARLDVGPGGQGGTVVELQWTPTEPARSALSIWRGRLRRGFLRATAMVREKRGTTS